MEPEEHHPRHQASLEGLIDFTSVPPFNQTQRITAKYRFYFYVNHFLSEEVVPSTPRTSYSRPKLIQYTFEYSLSRDAQDNFLRAFFKAINSPFDGPEADMDEIRPSFYGFAEFLMDNFFLPMKAAGTKTPQPSAAFSSAVRDVQSTSNQQGFIGSAERISSLRELCLTRDRHRCVISRSFDSDKASERFRQGPNATDDDGNHLLPPFETLVVAHIFPHSLMKIREEDVELSDAKQAALSVLNMFDTGIARLIEGVNIDQPRNAMSMTHTLHHHFGSFDICFEATGVPHTYKLKSFLPTGMDLNLPATRSLFQSPTIDPPRPRFLAVHRAIAYILHLSGAGAYADKILQDLGKEGIRSNGSTELGRLVNLRMEGWLAPAVGAFS